MKVSVRRAFTSQNQDKMYVTRQLGEGHYDDSNMWVKPQMSRPMPIMGVVQPFNDRDLLINSSEETGDGLEYIRYNAKLTTKAVLQIRDRVMFAGINYKVVNNRDFQTSGFSTYLLSSHDPLFPED